MNGHLRVINKNIPTDIIDYIDFRVKAAKYREEFANRQGLEDRAAAGYNRSEALKNFPLKNHHYYFVTVSEKRIGLAELQEEISQMDGQKIGVITALYAEEEYREYKLFEEVVLELQEMYAVRIEIDMWFEQTELEYCRKFGFRNISTRMTLN